MGHRRKARELALKALFELDFNPQNVKTLFDRVQRENDVEPEVLQFLEHLLLTYEKHHSTIDALIGNSSNHWRLSRMTSVDRNILRLGVTEILFFDDIPKSVTINECLEIAKKFGTDESSCFVNGVLDQVKKE